MNGAPDIAWRMLDMRITSILLNSNIWEFRMHLEKRNLLLKITAVYGREWLYR
jgi:hypothetical protein